MNTIVYISRHSQSFKNIGGEYNVNEEEQLINEKIILSVLGEEKAKKLCDIEELKNVEILYSSHYVRAMSTAKYIAEMNNIKLNVDERFGERKFGVKTMSELPNDFFVKQWTDFNYKIGNGESINEVSKRMFNAFKEVLEKNNHKTIMIVGHGTSITALLKNFCEVRANFEKKLLEIYFNNNLIFDGNWSCPELFKLIFDDDNNLIEIKNIRD